LAKEPKGFKGKRGATVIASPLGPLNPCKLPASDGTWFTF
jgi:hypothetical protein